MPASEHRARLQECGSIRGAEIEREHPGDIQKIYHLVAGENYRRSQETGDAANSVWSCGNVAKLIDGVPTCEELIEGMVGEAEAVNKGRLQGACQ